MAEVDPLVAIVDPDEVKRHLRIEDNEWGSSHPLIISLINGVSGRIAEYLNRSLISAARAEIRDGNGKRRMHVLNPPITGSVTVYYDRENDDNWQEISATWDISSGSDPNTGEVWLLDGETFPAGFRTVKFSYTGGYADVASIPAAIRLAACELIAWYRKLIEGKLHGEKSKAVEGITVKNFDFSNWPPHVLMLLDPYKREPLGVD